MSLFASSVNRSDKGAAVSKTLGVILIVLGLFGLAWGGFTYTTREKVVGSDYINGEEAQTQGRGLPVCRNSRRIHLD